MGAFCKAVQNEEIAGPLRRQFRAEGWHAEHARLGEDEADSNLHRAGILLHDKANAIRSRLQVTYSKDVNATTKLRSFVAVANHSTCVLEEKTRQALDRAVADSGGVVLPELASLKLKLPIGEEFSPNEIIQSMVDGSELAIKAILEAAPKHAAAFRERLHPLGIVLPETFQVLPVVILNGPVHAGFEVDGVPIVDMNILSVFFSGELIEVARRRAHGEIENVKNRVLYADVDQAARSVQRYPTLAAFGVQESAQGGKATWTRYASSSHCFPRSIRPLFRRCREAFSRQKAWIRSGRSRPRASPRLPP